MEQKLNKIILLVQSAEETEHLVYMRLDEISKDNNNAVILRKIGMQEKSKNDIFLQRLCWLLFSVFFLQCRFFK